VTGFPKETYVRYGEREDEMDKLVVASVKRYEREHMCDAPANQSVGWRDPGFIHDALITGLEKGRRYYYKVFLLSFCCWVSCDIALLGLFGWIFLLLWLDVCFFLWLEEIIINEPIHFS